MQQSIYLIGYMGVGKSFLGRNLAKSLQWTFVDLDDEIENYSGQTVDQLFSKFGESVFRIIEQQCLKATTRLSHVVVATGGGTPTFGYNAELMNQHGVSIYLQASVDILSARLENAYRKRPLIEGLAGQELSDFIQTHLAKRLSYYERAQYHMKIAEEKSTNLAALTSLVSEIQSRH